MKMKLTIVAVFLLAFCATYLSAATYDGTIKLGGVILDEQAGDLSSVQETYNLQDGFSISQLRLNGNLDMKQQFMINLHEINLNTGKADVLYRHSSKFRFTGRYDQQRWVFDPDRASRSDRQSYRFGARYTPVKEFRLSANYNFQNRDGDRLAFPAGTASQLGIKYDNRLHNGRLEGEYRKGGRALAVAFDLSSFSNKLDDVADRTGRIVSARFYTPDIYFDKVTHMFRAAYGTRKVTNADLQYKLMNFQYTGAFKPTWRWLFNYQFHASRVEDDATILRTDGFLNNFDATYFHRYGRVFGGYGYEMNDDDRRITTYQSWLAGATIRYKKYVHAEGSYSNRNKDDKEDLTLLKDIESDQIRAKLQIQPTDDLVLGGRFAQRQRKLTTINVEAEGQSVNGYGRYQHQDWGSISADYTYTTDDYDDLAGSFETRTHVVTARLDFSPIMIVNRKMPDIKLAGGVTYIDVGKDLDIEKSFVFVEGLYRFKDDYFVEAKYNVYNYDDYVLINRYYTANVVWINVGYDFKVE